MKKSTEAACKIAQHIHRWLNEYCSLIKSSSPHTIKSYSLTLSLYIGFLEAEQKMNSSSFCPNCFSRNYIEKWIVWLRQDRGSSAETCNIRLASLRAFLKYLGSRDVSLLYLFIEASQIPRQKVLKRKVNGMSKNAVKALMTAPDVSTKTGRRYLALLILMYNTAARIDEILSLRVQHLHLDMDKPYATVIAKGGKIRTLYLLPRTVVHLNRYMKEFHFVKPNPEAYVFYSRNTGSMGKMTQSAVNKQIRKYAVSSHALCAEVPITLHAHQIRHAKAAHWLEDGMNIIQISFLLGHANIQTTMVYLDITTEQEAEALATLKDENTATVSKKWKSNLTSLAAFCGLG